MTPKSKRISVWFFAGLLLLVNGIAVFGAGIYWYFVPAEVVLAELHASIWWGCIMMCCGVLFVIKNKPLGSTAP